MEWTKEKMADAAAATKAGMEKTKATVGEKVDKMKADDNLDKDLATQKKEVRKTDAELRKQEAYDHNAAQKAANTAQKNADTAKTTTTTTRTTDRPFI